MIYLNTKTNQRLSEPEMQAIVPIGEDLKNYDLVILESNYPNAYDPELYQIPVDQGNEEFTEEREVQIPDFMAMPGSANAFITEKTTISGWRIKWGLVPKDLETVRKILVARLGVKKKQVEDSGITLSSGMSVATAESDRTRILAMKSAYDHNPSNPKLGTLKFKNADNVFAPLDKSLITPLYEIMTDRTLDVFAREAAIQEAFYVPTDPAEAIAVYDAQINVDWPSSNITM